MTAAMVDRLGHPIRWLRQQLGGEAALPVLVLSGMNLLDELDQAAYGLFGPDIVREFGISPATFGLAFLPAVFLGMGLPVAVGYLTDRVNRVKLSVVGAAVWCVFAIATGFVPAFWMLVVVRMMASVGRGVSGPTHNSLLSDYYAVSGRGAAFSLHQNANPIGQFLGFVLAGAIAINWGWQSTFLILPLPGLVLLVMMARLDEPSRGKHERGSLGSAFDDADAPKLSQAVALLRNIRSWRRFTFVWLFLAMGLALASVLPFYFEAVFGIGPFGRGAILGTTALLSAVGAIAGGVISQRQMSEGRYEAAGRLVMWSIIVTAVAVLGLAFAPSLPVALLVLGFTTPLRALAAVPVTLILSATMPARLRGQGFGIIWFFFALGYLFLPISLGFGDAHSYRASLLLAVVPLVLGAAFAASAARHIRRDVERANSVSESEVEVRRRRDAGEEIDLLEVAGLEVAYGEVQVLFGVDMRVREGEMVALLGTNGAGKSTLLRAISGLIKPREGMVLFDGEDITGMDAEETTRRGIVHVPGGKGVFPSLTVEKNLRLGSYLYRDDPAHRDRVWDEVLDLFPRLGERLNQPAGTLSGGEQQMVTLAQAFMAKPRVLAIDELSLGLAPVIVEELLAVVERINASGVTVVLVEQSVNIALSLTERAYFMEKGEVRFEGPSSDLLERDDLVRSVFLAGAASVGGGAR